MYIYIIYIYRHIPYGPCCDLPATAPGSRCSRPRMHAPAGNCSFQAVAQRRCYTWCFGNTAR